MVKPIVVGFGSVGLDPRFTTLCYQMLIIAMGSNFHSFYPRQPHQRLIFALLTSLATVCRASVSLQFCG